MKSYHTHPDDFVLLADAADWYGVEEWEIALLAKLFGVAMHCTEHRELIDADGFRRVHHLILKHLPAYARRDRQPMPMVG